LQEGWVELGPRRLKWLIVAVSCAKNAGWHQNMIIGSPKKACRSFVPIHTILDGHGRGTVKMLKMDRD
jgi:hypothetical protein